jgi:transcription antitermination factor NusA-like protein
MTEETTKDFKGVGSVEDMLSFLDTIVHSIMPDADGCYSISLVLDKPEKPAKVQVVFNFEDDKFVGLLIGKKMRNILMIRTWLISQQIYIINKIKDIEIVINKRDGEVKTFGKLRSKP